ncbi:hypothetical protein OHB26_06250 [Nocardia sp. NBC_01503]|uniref:hypothetical protein n=1 Tax=Nocardia sp. NBC_01503 TaxID=2975997 RepID=UPI002E7BB92E|nr:hypothetical protein [Nocardia sp. NBC_01503]WTL33815.1 hypothetical protein OHB26_06250 [Nocardia sp. NBC_01503]
MGAAEAKQAQLAELRRRMAAIPARGAETAARRPAAVGAPPSPRPLVTGAPPGVRERSDGALRGLGEDTRALTESLRREALPVPPVLENLLPEGGLAKGSVVLYSGAHSLLSGLLASVTGSGGYAAVVGMPRLGLLAAAEMGARLDRLAVVADPGSDPLEVASVLLDGLDLVVLGLNGAAVPMSRTRVLTAKARSKGATLVVTGGSWAGPVLRIDTEVTGYSGLGRGCGRLRTVLLNVSVRSRSAQPRTGHLTLCPSNGRVEWVATNQAVAANHGAAEPLTAAHHAVS